jgi:hypothetical protein
MRVAEIEKMRRCTAIVVLALGPLLAGCSSDRLFGTSSSPAPEAASTASPSVTDRVANFFSGASSSATASSGPGGPLVDADCPAVDIRQGASTLTIPPGDSDANALTLRYQGTISQIARECSLLAGNTMKIKVGVQGRIIIGPAGGPGKIDVPLRYAVVQEGPEPKTIVTKLYRFPVAVPEGQPSVPFTHIDESITFPVPKLSELDTYMIYVGFDPAGEKPAPAKKPAPRRAPAPKTAGAR